MREILFRGKRKDNGEWVEGFLVIAEDTFKPDNEKTCFILEADASYFGHGEFSGVERVIPETIGQFTGLTDKNGKKVFEGDILKTDKFSEPNKKYIVKYDLQFGAFIGQDRYNVYFVTFDGDSDQFEIIGNIHDNPELLKEE